MQNFWHEHKHFVKGFVVAVLATLVVGVFGTQTGDFLASVLDLEKPAPFDGTNLPIETVPDWTVVGGRTSLLAAQIPLNEMTALPNYDPAIFGVTVADLNYSIEKDLVNKIITYAVPYMGSYETGSREYEGSHLAIDIKIPTGTPVHAVANGKVVKVAQASSGFGMHIVVKHYDVPDLNENETVDLYSAYAHLSKTSVNVGDIVTRGQLIGESGSTGTSTTPHLHFQIDNDNAPWHPWWPFTSADTSAAGVSFFDGVSAGIGQAAAIENTINPMLWVQRYLVTDETQTYDSDLHASSEDSSVTETETVATTTVADTSEQVETPTETETVATAEEENHETEQPDTTTEPAEEESSNQVAETETTQESIFTDVDTAHPNAKAIKYLKENEIVGGYDDGSFQPDKTVNRVEALKMLILGFGIIIEPKLDLGFTDTSNQQWYSDFVGTAMNRGIAGGYPDNTFRPGNTINRAEYLKILLGSASIAPDSVTDAPYSDVSADAWFSAYAAYSKVKNIFPLAGDVFNGSAGVTRAEVAETIYRILVLQNTGASAYTDDLEI